jgi:hypothetical protein
MQAGSRVIGVYSPLSVLGHYKTRKRWTHAASKAQKYTGHFRRARPFGSSGYQQQDERHLSATSIIGKVTAIYRIVPGKSSGPTVEGDES